ncbi:hypothetical protein HDK90DRAFT_468230 [Phyllosticta capitalensis]|uniref:BTB domain-containing protein n=1 Tax=Phyllosticta capitalensis TaxID=121624 RepID=A0ABR1YJ95_9PEZI
MWSYLTGSSGDRNRLVGGKVIGGPTQEITVTYKGIKWQFQRGMLSNHSGYFNKILKDGRTATVNLDGELDSEVDPFIVLEALLSTRSNCQYYDVIGDTLPLLWHARMYDAAVRLKMPALSTSAAQEFGIAANMLRHSADHQLNDWVDGFVDAIYQIYDTDTATHGEVLRHMIAGLTARKLSLLMRKADFGNVMAEDAEFGRDVALAMLDLVDEQRRTHFPFAPAEQVECQACARRLGYLQLEKVKSMW